MRELIFCGDIHGEFETFVWTALNRFKLREADIVILGDFGVGFDNTLSNTYKHMEKRLENADIMIYALRGNHDDPKYFANEEEYSYPRLRFMEDYKIYELAGRKILPIGGANSTDIVSRKKNNEEWARKGKSRREWWEGESVKEKELSELPGKVDIIISHTCPISFEPIATRLDDTPVEQYEKILKERNYLESVKSEVNFDLWMYGHFHDSFLGSTGKFSYRGLGIMEFYEAPEPKISNPQG